MRNIVEVVLPFFALVGVGYLAARWRLIGLQGNQGLATFVYWFAIPMLLFRGIATRDFAELTDVRLLAVYAISTVVLFFAVRTLARRTLGVAREYANFHGFAAAQGNNGFLAIPLMPALFGEQAVALVALTLFADMLVLYPLVFILADLASAQPRSAPARMAALARTFYTNPYLVAMLAGLVVAAAGVTLPGPVMAFATLLGQAGPPTALFALGAALGIYTVSASSTRDIALMNAGKLAVHPILVWVLGTWIVPLPPLALAVGVAIAALPTGINLFLFSQRYVANVGVYSAAILSSTATAVVTFSAVVALLTY